jgi:hypothetical protein
VLFVHRWKTVVWLCSAGAFLRGVSTICGTSALSRALRAGATQNSRTAEQQNGRTAEQQNSRTAEQQNSRTAEQQNGRTAE